MYEVVLLTYMKDKRLRSCRHRAKSGTTSCQGAEWRDRSGGEQHRTEEDEET